MKINVSCELPKTDAEKFRKKLKESCIRYEASECGNLVHFEVLASGSEIESLNNFIDTL